MAAEEVGCGGGGEVQEAEFPVKEAPAASPERKELEKHMGEGDAVSNPIVVANTNSGDLSGEVSDLEAKLDPAVLGENGEVGSNAASGCAETAHETGVEGIPEAGAVDDASMVNGHLHPKALDCVVDEGNGELAVPEISGLVEQEMDDQELDVTGVTMSDLHDHMDTGISESKVHVEDNSIKQTSYDVTELMEHGTISGEQDVSDVSMTNRHAHVGKSDDCGTGAKEPDVDDNQSNGEETAANSIKQMTDNITELMQQKTISLEQDVSDVSMANAHVGISGDCGAGAEEPDADDDQSNGEEIAANSVKLVKQYGLDGYVTNGYELVDTSADVDVAAAVLEVHESKSKGQDTATFVELDTTAVELDQVDISMTNQHDQVVRNSHSGEVEAKSELCGSEGKRRECATELVRQEAMTGEQGTENESVVNGCDHPNTSADLCEAPTEAVVCSKDGDMVQSVDKGVESVNHERILKVAGQQTEGDTKVSNKGVPREEDIVTNRYEHLEESGSSDVNSVLEPLAGDGKCDFTVVDRLDNRTEDNGEEILQETCTSGVDKAAVETDALDMERNGEAALEGTEKKEKHEKPNDEILQVDNLFNDNVEGSVQGDELIKADGDVSTFQPAELVSYSTAETEKEEIKEPACLKEASLISAQQQTAASFQENEHHISATSVNHIADHTDNDKTDTELKQELDMEIFDGAKLYAAPKVVSAETRSLADNDGAEVEHSFPAFNLGGALTGDSDSSVNSTVAVAQFEDDDSKEHKTTIDENFMAMLPQVEKDGPSIDDVNSPADGPIDEICSENLKACTTSCESRTEYLQDIASTTIDVIHNKHNGDENIHDDNTDTTLDHSESQLEINMDNENRGDLQVIIPNLICLMKVPKFTSETLWAKIQNAQICLDELTQKRDAINVLRQKKKALCEVYRQQWEAAREEERGARAAHGDKRQDLNSVQSMIGRLNKANSIQDIDAMIAMKENIIAHESISLKEEKCLLQEIKELKAQKKQLQSNIGSKTEIYEAFHNKEHIHEQQKILKKDSGVLLTNLKSLEDKTRFIKKALDDERDALRKLNEEHRAANEERQKAYEEWFELKKEPGKKNKFFFMYRKDSRTAQGYSAKRDMMGLVLFCNNQVESFMALWNKDDDFRRQYVESNKISTLKRLGTSDGRKLGPDEIPPEIPRNFNRMQSTSLLPVSSKHALTSASEAMPPKPALAVTTAEKESFPVLQGSQSSKTSKPKGPTSSSNETLGAPVPQREDVEKIDKEKKHRMEEDLELARQAAELARREEELRQEKAAAEKERLRLEQKAKAKEAEERKRRKAEKAQERAEFRARKEAKLMEKKRVKKDKKKGSTSVDLVNGNGEHNVEATATNDTDPCTTENSREIDFAQHNAPKKRPSRSSVALKQLNKMEPMPLALRNKGRRKMRQYSIVAVVAAVSVLALVMASKFVHSNFRASSS